MTTRRSSGPRHVLLLALAALAATGATCNKLPVDAKPARLTPDVHGGASGETSRGPAVSDIEGLDLAEIPPSRRADVLGLLNGTYCYCGCPRTLAACLANKKDCSCVRCSDRMASFIVGEVKEGVSNEDVEAQLLEGFSAGYNGKPVAFETKDAPARGPADAPYTVVEFADFRCPHCAAAYDVLEELVDRRGDVRLVFLYFPLGSGGDRSVRAAEAAEEARVQGKFWEMARTLFRNQHALESDDLLRYAKEVGLDVERFKEALESHTHRDKVSAAKRAGESAGVQGTPSLYVNGRPFGLARTANNLEMRFAMESERGRCE